jgi:hypothetical protein
MMTRTTLKTICGGITVALLAAAAVGLCAQSKPSPDGAIRLIDRGIRLISYGEYYRATSNP